MSEFKKQVEAFFFRAMQAGYAQVGRTTAPVAEMPSSKSIPFREGDWYLLDVWFTNRESGKSAGTTQIWYKGQLVWFMHYWGYYEERAVPFLKSALRQQYGYEAFCGGRGPRITRYRTGDEYLIYRNQPESNDFGDFHGSEEIMDASGGIEVLGYHEYMGRMLV